MVNGKKAVPTDAGSRISTPTTFFITTFIKTYPNIEICFAFGAFILLCNNFIWFFISHIMTFTFFPLVLRQDPIQFVHVMTSSKFFCVVWALRLHTRPGERNQFDFSLRSPIFRGENEDICYCWWREHWIFPSLVWHKFCLWRVKKNFLLLQNFRRNSNKLRRSNEDYFTLRNLKKGVSKALTTLNLHFRVPKCRSLGLFNYKSPLFLNWTLELLMPKYHS